MKRVALYARYSDDKQSEMSILDQFRVCEQRAEREGWTIVARFEDAALIGAAVHGRRGYHALMTAIHQTPRPFDILLAENLGRLSRDMVEPDLLYRRCLRAGIVLVGASDGIDSSRPGARFHIGIMGLKNALYLDDLAAQTHRGLTGSVERGLSAGGKLFGYRTVPVPGEPGAARRQAPARNEVDPVEAEIVRRIFSDYSGGLSMATIAHALNREGVPFPAKDTKRGLKRHGWAVSTIHTILHNEKYAGCGPGTRPSSCGTRTPGAARPSRAPARTGSSRSGPRCASSSPRSGKPSGPASRPSAATSVRARGGRRATGRARSTAGTCYRASSPASRAALR